MQADQTRQKKILEYLYITKLFTFLIFGLAAFNEYMKYIDYEFTESNYFYDLIPITIFMFIILLTTRLWFASIHAGRNAKRDKFYRIAEPVLNFFLLSCLIGYAPEVPQYKLLFLLMIMTSSLQYGFRYGLVISIISSVIVLAIDLNCMPNHIVNEQFQNDLIIIGVYILTAWLLGYYEKVQREHREHITRLAIIDGLTEVYNHRYFYDALKGILDNARRTDTSVSLLFIDIDNFKFYNDLVGHQKGDQVLKTIARILKENTRDQDLVSRYGGEEFAIILVDTQVMEAKAVAERIRDIVAETKFEEEEHQPDGRLTVSIGVSTFPENAQSDTDLVKSADDALYRAKFFNKNRVETYFSILHELKSDLREEDIALITSIKTLIFVINAKDRYTYGHTERVVMLAQLLGNSLHLSEEDMKTLKYSAYLHDIGKINIPEQILNKKMPLTEEEWNLLKQHPKNGVGIISPVDFLEKIKPVILHHHERYDGDGYPSGLQGEDIPYLARIMTVVDSFDAMTSNRVYRARRSLEDAIDELRKCKGTQFDPDITEAFIEMLLANRFSNNAY